MSTKSELQVKCRGKIVYVPLYVASQYTLFDSYLKNWNTRESKNSEDLLEINDYPPEVLQAEIDKKVAENPIESFLGYTGEIKKEEKDKKELFFEDLFEVENGKLTMQFRKIIYNIAFDEKDLDNCGLHNGASSNNYIEMNGRVHLLCCKVIKVSTAFDIEFKIADRFKVRLDYTWNVKDKSWAQILHRLCRYNDFLKCFYPSRYDK